MNVDAALRYLPVVKLISKRQNNFKKPILEVGSGTNGISDFYEGKVTGLDSDFSKTKLKKNPNMTHIKGSIFKIPFKANYFSIVICLDTFEHLPQEKRTLALEELLRVTKKKGRVFLGFPTGLLSKFTEKLATTLYKKTRQKDYPWLKEHEYFGLPDQEVITKYLNSKRLKFKKISNHNLLIWLGVFFLYMVNEGNKIGKAADLFSPLILRFCLAIKFPPFYRIIFLIEK